MKPSPTGEEVAMVLEQAEMVVEAEEADMAGAPTP